MIKEKPILFKPQMVSAILDGRKTQTRRIVKNRSEMPEFMGGKGDENDPDCWGWECHESGLHIHMIKPEDVFSQLYYCPYYEGLELWVRETWTMNHDPYHGNSKIPKIRPSDLPDEGIHYRATETDSEVLAEAIWKPSIYMPRWASRIQLCVTDVRVERLQDISEEDAWKEGGWQEPHLGFTYDGLSGNTDDMKSEFCDLWKKINGADSWGENPWVWVIEFERL